MSKNVKLAQREADKERVEKEHKIVYTSPVDEKGLKLIDKEIGKCYCPKIAEELERFWISMIAPREITAEDNEFGLPLYLYSTVNPYLQKMKAYTNEAQKNYGFLTYAPDWYFDAMEKLANVELTNNFIAWSISYYNRMIHDEVSRKLMQEKYPWIRRERAKHYHIVKTISNKIFDIRNEGIRHTSDLLFLYFVSRYLLRYASPDLPPDDLLFINKYITQNSLKDTTYSSFEPKRDAKISIDGTYDRRVQPVFNNTGMQTSEIIKQNVNDRMFRSLTQGKHVY